MSVLKKFYYEHLKSDFSHEINCGVIDYVKELEKQNEELKQKNKNANEFIREIAIMLDIGADGLGYDGLAISFDDFKDVVRRSSNE